MKLQKLLQIACLPLFLSTMLASGEALAELDGPTYPDRGMIQLGGLYVFDSDTSVSASGATGLGTTIDFSEDLDGDSDITTPAFEAYYRFNNRHRLELAAFQLDRDGSRVITREITFRDRTFSTSNQIDSSINNDIYKLAYAYSFYHVNKVELAISAGLNVMDYEVQLASSAGGFAETAQTTAPMPVFGFRMDYAVTPRFTARFRTDSFYFDFEDKIRGSLLELQVGAEYRLLRNFALGASLTRLAIAVDVNDDDYTGRLDDLYRGARVYGSFYF